MLRFIFFVLYAALVLFASLFVLSFIHIFWKNKPEKRDKFAQNFVKAVFRHVRFIAGVKTTVIGLENIPTDTPVLFVGNHRSIFDILISYEYFNRPTGYVAKKEMERFALLNTWMRHIHCLFLDRTNPKEGLKTILIGIEEIKNGYSMVIFPEGTRSKTEGMLPFKEGSLKMAEKSGCAIVPMTQNNTSAVWEDQWPFFKKTHTVIEFGKPIIISELAPEDKKFLGAYTQKIIEETYNRNQSLI